MSTSDCRATQRASICSTRFVQRPEFDKAPVLILTGATLSAAEEALITRNRGFLFYKPEGFDTLVRFLDVLTGRDRPG